MDELSPAVRAFLQEPRFAVLATVDPDGNPQQTVMWYELLGDHILMNTARGRIKDRNLRRDPRLSICIEDGYRYVALAGTAELVDEQATALDDITRLAVRYHGSEKGAAMRAGFAKEQRVTLRMAIRSVVANGFE